MIDMIHLKQFIRESMINEAFNKTFDTTKEYIEYFKNKYGNKWSGIDNEFVKLVVKEWDKTTTPAPFIIDDNQTIIKIHPNFKDNISIQKWLSEHPNKIGNVIDLDDLTFSFNNITYKWGKGSIGSSRSSRIPTEIQEQISCEVFNCFFGNKKTISQTDLTNKDWGQFDNFFKENKYKDWILSWANQYNTINSVINKWSDAIAIHYDDKTDIIAKCLREMHTKICNVLLCTNHNVFDPTDIIIYDPKQIGYILREFKLIINSELSDKNSLLKAAISSLSKLYDNKAYVGISLKKGNNFEAFPINFAPPIGFENANLQNDIPIDPLYSFFGDNQSLIDEFNSIEIPTNIDDAYIKYIKDFHNRIQKKVNRKRSKSAILTVDCDDYKNIKIAIRSNQSGGNHPHLVIEPRLDNKKAQIGKVPVHKWTNELFQYNKELFNVIDTKGGQYDIDQIVNEFNFIKTSYFKKIKTTSDQLRRLFEVFSPIDKSLDNYLYSYAVQINIISAILKSNDISTTLRKILLWAEKSDTDCLPYILIKPE